MSRLDYSAWEKLAAQQSDDEKPRTIKASARSPWALLR